MVGKTVVCLADGPGALNRAQEEDRASSQRRATAANCHGGAKESMNNVTWYRPRHVGPPSRLASVAAGTRDRHGSCAASVGFHCRPALCTGGARTEGR